MSRKMSTSWRWLRKPKLHHSVSLLRRPIFTTEPRNSVSQSFITRWASWSYIKSKNELLTKLLAKVYERRFLVHIIQHVIFFSRWVKSFGEWMKPSVSGWFLRWWYKCFSFCFLSVEGREGFWFSLFPFPFSCPLPLDLRLARPFVTLLNNFTRGRVWPDGTRR